MRSTKHFIFQKTPPQGGQEIPLDNATFNTLLLLQKKTKKQKKFIV
jgi:hypothetical protein